MRYTTTLLVISLLLPACTTSRLQPVGLEGEVHDDARLALGDTDEDGFITVTLESRRKPLAVGVVLDVDNRSGDAVSLDLAGVRLEDDHGRPFPVGGARVGDHPAPDPLDVPAGTRRALEVSFLPPVGRDMRDVEGARLTFTWRTAAFEGRADIPYALVTSPTFWGELGVAFFEGLGAGLSAGLSDDEDCRDRDDDDDRPAAAPKPELRPRVACKRVSATDR